MSRNIEGFFIVEFRRVGLFIVFGYLDGYRNLVGDC